MTWGPAAAGGAARGRSAAATPSQAMPGTVNLVTQWKSATTRVRGSASSSAQFHRCSRPDTWDLRVGGATESGREHRWNWAELDALPRTRVVADFHCVTKFTVPGIAWERSEERRVGKEGR